MNVVCSQYENHYESNPPIPTTFLRELMRLILEENSFKFHNRHFVQTRGIAVGTKMAVAFSIIYMADFEERLLKASPHKPLVWKRFIDDIFSLWVTSTAEVTQFVDFANSFHSSIKLTCEMSPENAVFLDTEVFKGPRGFSTLKLLDVRTHFKPTETFPSLSTLSIPRGVLSKEKHCAYSELTQSKPISKNSNGISRYVRLYSRHYPDTLIRNTLATVQFSDKTTAIRPKQKRRNEILPFVTTYNPALKPNLKKILMKHWHLIQGQPNISLIFKQPPIVSYKKERSRAKIPSSTQQS